MFHLVIKIIGLAIILMGVICVYDARLITRRFFGFGDQNEATSGMKILGFILSVTGGLVIFFSL